MLKLLRVTINKDLPVTDVYTFTHEPLIGVVTMTDQNGTATSYEYDEFQRLIASYDQRNDLLKSLEYHYSE